MLIVQDRVSRLRSLVRPLRHLLHVLLARLMADVMMVITIGMRNWMVGARLIVLELILLILL